MKKKLALLSLLFTTSLLLASEDKSSLLETYKDAIKNYKKNPGDYKNGLKLANVAFDAGNFKQAYDLVLLLLEERKDEARALNLYSSILIQYGYTDKAKRKLNKIVSLYPDSPEAIQARKSLYTLKRMQSSVQSIYNFQLGVGIDSFPGLSKRSLNIVNYLSNIYCLNQIGDCSIQKNTPSLNPSISTKANGDYLYDIGDSSGFFLKYGWSLKSQNYIEDISADSFSYEVSIEPGYATQGLGSFQLRVSSGSYFNALNITNTGATEYNVLEVSPNYSYQFSKANVLSAGFIMLDESADKYFEYEGSYYDGYSGITLTSYVQYKHMSDSSYYSVNLSSAGFFNFDSYYDPNIPSPPTGRYSFVAANLSYAFKNSFASFKAKASFENRLFNYAVSDSNFTSETRMDDSMELSLEMKFSNGFLSGSALGYKLYANISNYAPMNFTQHNITYNYYWKP